MHLMVSPVDRIVADFAEAGASYITFHPEASPHVDRTLQVRHLFEKITKRWGRDGTGLLVIDV